MPDRNDDLGLCSCDARSCANRVHAIFYTYAEWFKPPIAPERELSVNTGKCFGLETEGTLRVAVWFWRVGIFQGFVRMGYAIFFQFRIAQMKMALGRVILRCRKLAMQFVGANVRRVLVSHAAGVKCCVGYRDCVFARLGFALSNGKRVFADEGFCLKADELDDDVFAHGVPETDFLPLKRKGGPVVPVRLLL
jgi:hypothetical protein